MPCYSPIAARRSDSGGVILLGCVHDRDRPGNFPGRFRIRCGRCVGCRLLYSQMWAIRCVHEARMHEANCVVTLTYDDGHLPANGSLHYRDFQLFMKRLRKRAKVRFFCGGEYGEGTLRPHFHACLFGYDFPDKVVYSNGRTKLWTSAIADAVWQKGRAMVGVMDFDSAAYVARYVLKKVYGDLAHDHYRVGEPEELRPEFATMSRRPGIGRTWIEKFWPETLRDLSVVSRGRRVHMPRAYVEFVESIADTSRARAELDKRMKQFDLSPARLSAGAKIASARLGLSRRKL